MKTNHASDVKTQLSIQNWTEIIKDRNATNLPIDEYCKLHDLSRNSYYYWLRKIRELSLVQNDESQNSNPIVEIKADKMLPTISEVRQNNQVITLTVNGITLSNAHFMRIFSRFCGIIKVWKMVFLL